VDRPVSGVFEIQTRAKILRIVQSILDGVIVDTGEVGGIDIGALFQENSRITVVVGDVDIGKFEKRIGGQNTHQIIH